MGLLVISCGIGGLGGSSRGLWGPEAPLGVSWGYSLGSGGPLGGVLLSLDRGDSFGEMAASFGVHVESGVVGISKYVRFGFFFIAMMIFVMADANDDNDGVVDNCGNFHKC